MFEMFLLNNKGEKFSKFFENEFLFKKFLAKIKHSKNLTYLGYRRN